jgi:hypothetical protein
VQQHHDHPDLLLSVDSAKIGALVPFWFCLQSAKEPDSTNQAQDLPGLSVWSSSSDIAKTGGTGGVSERTIVESGAGIGERGQ